MVRSRAPVDVTSRSLLTAAHDLLESQGLTALTVRRIAAAAGVSTMNVYSRFGGKDGVLDELFSDGFRRLGEQMAATPSTVDPLADLHATLTHLASRVERAMDAGVIARRDPFHVAMALWACQHGLVSLAARTTDVEAFDWDVVAPMGSAAMVRGLASDDG